MGIDERDVLLNGRRVHYLVAGSGRPLLLVHGVGESSAYWRGVLPRLADRYTVYAPDLPGYGDSAPLGSQAEDGPTPERFAAEMADFLDAVTDPDAGPAVVVGHSLGGSVALELALRHPERVSHLVLEDAAGLGYYVNPALRALTTPGYGDVAGRVGRTPTGALHRAWARVPLMFAQPQLAPPEWVAEQRRLATLPHHLPTSLTALRAQVGAFAQRWVLLNELDRIRVPTLVLWGAQDAVVPVYQAHAAVARLAQGRLVVVPRCGHVPHLERPEQFLDAVLAFDGAERSQV
jgi:4,5:9,10-diseco-3-hydroxy-5,9,17-trioxoandrosta-1(10),2-diene-4-oate hydrolase